MNSILDQVENGWFYEIGMDEHGFILKMKHPLGLIVEKRFLFKENFEEILEATTEEADKKLRDEYNG